MPRRSVYRSVIESGANSGHWMDNPCTAAYINAYRALPECDRVAIDGLVAHLVDAVSGMGVQAALELLAKLGMWMIANHEGNPYGQYRQNR